MVLWGYPSWISSEHESKRGNSFSDTQSRALVDLFRHNIIGGEIQNKNSRHCLQFGWRQLLEAWKKLDFFFLSFLFMFSFFLSMHHASHFSITAVPQILCILRNPYHVASSMCRRFLRCVFLLFIYGLSLRVSSRGLFRHRKLPISNPSQCM